MPAVEEIENIISNASQFGELGAEQARVLQQFLDERQQGALALYNSGLVVTSQMYEREKIARFWQNQHEFFEAQLAVVNRFEARLKNAGSGKLDLRPIVSTLKKLIDVCSEHYEFHA